jgi:hypothetical protein
MTLCEIGLNYLPRKKTNVCNTDLSSNNRCLTGPEHPPAFVPNQIEQFSCGYYCIYIYLHGSLGTWLWHYLHEYVHKHKAQRSSDEYQQG